MSLSGSWRQCLRRSSSPLEFLSAVGHACRRRLPTTSFHFTSVVRHSALLCILPLFAALISAAPAQAQTKEDVEILVFGYGSNTEGESALFTVVAGGRPAHDVTVELTISQEGDFLASGEAGKRRITVRGGREQQNFLVATRDDNRNEADGVVKATINPGKGYFPSPDATTSIVWIRDNDEPVVEIAAGPAVVEGGTATFNLTADPRPARRLQVSLTVEDGDFSTAEQLGKRTAWIETNGKGTLEVRTSADTLDEDDGYITATVDAGDDYEVGDSASATVEVTDGGAPTPRIRLSAPASIDEGDTATFTLSASPAPAAPVDVTVDLTEQGSFASAGEIGQRTVAVGTDGAGSFTVATENDRTAEADGSITATLAEGSGYLIRSPSEVSVTVRDTTPRVSITAGPDITEGGAATFTLTANPHLSESFDVTVNVSESGSFADGGETGSRTVTIGAGGTGTLRVTTSDDATLEADGTITAAVAAGAGYGVGSPTQASVSVADATPRVSIAAGGAIIEGDNASFTLTADPNPSGTIFVDVDVSDSGDFLAAGESGTRSVSIGSTGTATLEIATDDDNADEQQGSITVRIEDGQAPASYGVGTPRSASLRVNDDDAGEGSRPQLSVGDAEAREADSRNRIWLEFPVSLDRSTGLVTASFEIRATTETTTTAPATEGTDYRVRRASDLSVRFDGTTEATVRVEVLDDDEYEEKPETFELALTDITGAEIADGRAIGTILPDPADAPRGTPVVTIEGERAVTEGGRASFVLSVAPAPENDLVVTLSVYDDPTSDFLAAEDEGTRTVTVEGVNDRTFAALDGVVKQRLYVDTVDDETREDDGSIRMAVDSDPDPSAGGTYDPGAQDYEASVDVRDNEREVSVVSIRGGDEVTEGGEATFTLRADPAPGHDLIVSVFVHDDNASDFVDSAREGARTVTIEGVSDSDFARQQHTTRTLTVRTTDDDNREDDGSVRVAVENDPDPAAGGEYLVHDQSFEASVAVKDNERGVPTVTIDGGSAVTEGERATFTLRADPAPADDLTVTLTIYDDSASDFVDDNDEGTRTFTIRGVSDSAFARQRHTTRTLTVDTVDDSEREDDGSIRVVVETDPDPAVGGEYLANTQPYEASVSVQDNERAVPVVSIKGGDPVSEGGGATFTLTADPAPERDLTVTLTVYDDSANDFVAADDEGARTVTIRGVSDSAFARQRHTTRTVTVDTVDDSEREDDGSIRVAVEADPDAGVGGEYLAHAQSYEASVNVQDNERGVPTVTVTGGPAVAEGERATFTLRADPAPESDLTVEVTVYDNGSDFVADDEEGTREVTIKGVSDADFARQRHTTATLAVDTVEDTEIEATGDVRVTIQTDSDGNYDADTQPWEATVEVRDNDTPTVSVAPPFSAGSSATEGASLSFTLNVAPTSATELLVDVIVAQPNNDYVDADPNRGTGARTITIPANASSAVVLVDTVDDSTVETAPGTVTVTVEEGSGYVVAVPPGDAASAAVVDDDGLPAITIHDRTVQERYKAVTLKITLSEPSTEVVRVTFATNAARSTATAGEDYLSTRRTGTFSPGETKILLGVLVLDDSIDDPDETIIVELSDPVGAVIADGEAVITIENSDPLPSAWLTRFGRAVAETAVDGITARMAAPRAPGTEGAIGGYALGTTGAAWTSDVQLDGGASLSHPREAFRSINGPGFGARPYSMTRSMTLGDLLAGSRLAWTGGANVGGGSLGFWGQGSRASFDGAQDGVNLDGEVTTALLGADYARGNWLVGVALTQSRGDGGYRSLVRPGEAVASDAPVGDGAIATSLTAAIPYASWHTSERLDLWGAVGRGAGEITLEPESQKGLSTDIGWTMAAAGLRSDLFASASGSSLSLVSDALWARTTSDRISGLAATEGAVARLRLGLEGSRAFQLPGGGSLTPKLELGARHDGGDAETGFGVEVGSGVAWRDPRLGLALDIAGRALISHEDGAMRDRGFSASLAYDPRAHSARGLTLTLRQDIGSASGGGLNALFADDPIISRTGGYGSDRFSGMGRWSIEAGYGLPAFGGQFMGTPHMSYGASAFGRDFSVGWRLAPAAGPGLPELSFGVLATRRECNREGADHGVGIEFQARW